MPTPSGPLLHKVRRFSPTAVIQRVFWLVGLLLAIAQAWAFRYQVSVDSISYLDMSDGVLPGYDWHRLITGTWSPLYPLLLGLARRIFHVAPGDEIVAAHLFNVVLFVFAFLCFEFFLARLLAQYAGPRSGDDHDGPVAIPLWAYTVLAYSLFLWASVSAISLRNLRPDLLMSGFLYFAAGVLIDLRGRVGRWRDYVILGTVLGVGILAKEPMLPIGLLMLAISLFIVRNWKSALKMAGAAAVIMFAIGSLYFGPLSRERGHLTFGESGALNYLVHVDRAGPPWYLSNPGQGKGSFRHPPQLIFASPPVYAFPYHELVTHPLRFDPAEWMEGVRPRLALRRQIGELMSDFHDLVRTQRGLAPLYGSVLALALLASVRKHALSIIRSAWPVWFIGIAGCAMYLFIHLEPRYVGAFLLLFWCGVLASFLRVPLALPQAVRIAAVTVIVAFLLLPVGIQAGKRLRRVTENEDSKGASELARLGVHPGDAVARVTSVGVDLGMERIARVEIISEVDLYHANEFWSAPVSSQHHILSLFDSFGAKAVIASNPRLTPANQSEWKQLASTRYWVWLPAEHEKSQSLEQAPASTNFSLKSSTAGRNADAARATP